MIKFERECKGSEKIKNSQGNLFGMPLQNFARFFLFFDKCKSLQGYATCISVDLCICSTERNVFARACKVLARLCKIEQRNICLLQPQSDSQVIIKVWQASTKWNKEETSCCNSQDFHKYLGKFCNLIVNLDKVSGYNHPPHFTSYSKIFASLLQNV